MMTQTNETEASRPSFWNDNTGAILLLVLLCVGVMEAGALLMVRLSSHPLARFLTLPMVAFIGFLFGSRILASQKRFRHQLQREIQYREQEQLESQRTLKEALAELKSHNNRLLSFGEFTHKLLACRSESDIDGCTPTFAARLFPGTIGGLYRPDGSGNWKAACTWAEKNGLAVRVRPEVIVDDPTSMANEVAKAVRKGVTGRRYIALPVISGKELLAVTYIELSPQTLNGSVTTQMSYMATAFCEEMSLALSNLRLRSELSQQAIRDPLTGLFNRRYMQEALSRELKRAERHHTPLSLLMIDLDHFKQLNDQFGHDCGDAVLKGFGAIILGQSREEDIGCRYGGEEILLALPNTPLHGAVEKAQQIRAKIKRLSYLTKQRRQVTASIGVSAFPGHGSTTDALVKSADVALYTAKRLGRNRVCRADEAGLSIAYDRRVSNTERS